MVENKLFVRFSCNWSRFKFVVAYIRNLSPPNNTEHLQSEMALICSLSVLITLEFNPLLVFVTIIGI